MHGTSNLKVYPSEREQTGLRGGIRQGIVFNKLDVTEAEHRGSAARDGTRRQCRHQMEAYRVIQIRGRLVA